MPIYKIIKHKFANGVAVTVLVWKITESVEELLTNITLKPESAARFQGMKSELHQRGFMSIRHLLAIKNLSDEHLFYDNNGKPFLNNGRHISISHSFNFSAIVLSTTNIGIDIEQVREKIAKIAKKFCLAEFEFLNPNDDNYHKKLTAIWATKETVFKIENQKGISFKDHIKVSEFKNISIDATLCFKNEHSFYEMQQIEIENFILVFGIKI